MNSTVVNIRVEPKLKKEAQDVASELGLSLSSLINGLLKQVVRTKTVTFSTSEEPSEYLLEALRESREDIKAGRVISFESWEEEKEYLDKLIDNDKKANRN